MLSLNQYSGKKVSPKKLRIPNPAPTKLRFLLSRFWLRKRYRVTFFLAVLLVFISFVFHISFLKLKLHETFLESFKSIKEVVLGRPEFIIKEIVVKVDNKILMQEIIEVVDIHFPVNSLTLNLEETRRKINKLTGVKNVTVSVDHLGKLIVTAVERQPAIINKVGAKYFLLDKDGFIVNEVSSRSERLDLPLFIGKGLEKKIEEGLKLLLDLGPNASRVNALIWVGNRRWDIIFDKERVIKLPSYNPRESIKRIISLDFEFNILSSDVLTIDLRNEKFLVIRPNWKNKNTEVIGISSFWGGA